MIDLSLRQSALCCDIYISVAGETKLVVVKSPIFLEVIPGVWEERLQ